MKKITVWTEFNPQNVSEKVLAAYPQGMDAALSGIFDGDGSFKVTVSRLDDTDQGLSEKLLDDTDTLIYWAHCRHDEISEDTVARVVNAAHRGMGVIFLHSAHHAKIFKRLTGATGDLAWRENNEKERLWTVTPSHPIARGIPECVVIPHEEMYGEPFDIPEPECTVFIGWFKGGEVFRSGVTFRRGFGKIFYFQPGHETHPVYYQQEIRKIIKNAADWAAADIKRTVLGCPNREAQE